MYSFWLLKIRGDALLEVPVFHEICSCCSNLAKPSASYRRWSASNDAIKGGVGAVMSVAGWEKLRARVVVSDFSRLGGVDCCFCGLLVLVKGVIAAQPYCSIKILEFVQNFLESVAAGFHYQFWWLIRFADDRCSHFLEKKPFIAADHPMHVCSLIAAFSVSRGCGGKLGSLFFTGWCGCWRCCSRHAAMVSRLGCGSARIVLRSALTASVRAMFRSHINFAFWRRCAYCLDLIVFALIDNSEQLVL